ncbi:response regulator transcription factor [Acidimicrobiia bacterium EGI L10123]|uniref:response regulator transcription factor n=1 Tax=Salinilacustrithrix flava TaxID=2957203 RepID=UPI003D7C2152|nr:response regulator transcription factor [Acidimicrobiia bacterium EGI L10123]
MARILIVEDEDRIVSFLTKGLEANGHSTMAVGDGITAAAVVDDASFDLMILDIGLPGKDGFAVLQEIRERGVRLPVIVLTARDATSDTVTGFDAGADDYVTKPFRFEELLARVRARLRDQGTTEQTLLEAGSVVLDLRRRTVSVDGRSVELSSREFALAEALFRHPGQVLSREQLLSMVWGYDFEPESNVVDVYIGYLRRKLGADRIETVRGMGYRLRAG